jgi:nitroimidazol reductase NimA-like FMN-containing flavoprotein (pyridoxamine 5'-phosphate oxidase superfamily)
MTNELLLRAKEIADGNMYCSVATVDSNGEPWNTPVSYVYDETFHFYWLSWKDAEHSKNLRANPAVFINVFDSTRPHGQNHQRGLYVKAEAYEIDDADELARIRGHLIGLNEPDPDPRNYLGDNPKRIYKTVPKQLWLNNASASDIDTETSSMRVEVPLNELPAIA